jgi:hypothetical protein
MTTENTTTTFTDALGGTYEKNILPRHRIEAIIQGLTIENIVEEGWKAHVDDSGRTEVHLNLETGKMNTGIYSTGSSEIATDYILLFTIQQNTLGNSNWRFDGDILADDEWEEAKAMIDDEDNDIEEFYDAMEEMRIDFDERFVVFLCDNAELDHENIKAQLDEIFDVR